MKSFIEFINESKAQGNYVALDVLVPDLRLQYNMLGFDNPSSGESPPKDDYHCTLIYSKETNLDPTRVAESLVGFPSEINARVIGVECFDSIPEDGVRDEAKSCIVLRLESDVLNKMHDTLRGIGLHHSYPEYSAHVTLTYNMDVEEAHAYRDAMNPLLSGAPHQYIVLHNIRSETINEDYV